MNFLVVEKLFFYRIKNIDSTCNTIKHTPTVGKKTASKLEWFDSFSVLEIYFC